MSIRRSPKTSPSALHRTALTRTPVAGQRHILSARIIRRQQSASSRPGTSSRDATAIAFIAVIDTPTLIRSVQIPIAHRRI
jgi:hypothetical protein